MSGPATKDDMAKLGVAIDSLADATRKAGEEQAALLREFVSAVSEHRSGETARATGGRVEMNVTAGSLAAWVAATCCAVAMTGVLCLGGAVLWISIRTNDHGHQMNALYQSVPGLRELVAEQMRLNHETKQAERQEPTE